MKFYEKVYVNLVPLPEDEMGQRELDARFNTPAPAFNTSIIEMVEFMASFPLKDQVFMMANTLTIAGYSQREIAEALGIGYKTYRNRLWEIRGEFKDRGLSEI